eukprot:COSAG01_NODE_35259_length_534_cov_5.462069_1_plen_27_part_10
MLDRISTLSLILTLSHGKASSYGELAC